MASNYSSAVRAQLEFAFVNNMERNFGHFANFDHSLRRIWENARRATDDELLRGANANQQQLIQWSRTPGTTNVYWYH